MIFSTDARMDHLVTSANTDVAAWMMNPVIGYLVPAITDVAKDSGDQDVNYVRHFFNSLINISIYELLLHNKHKLLLL